jgi:hypothetical protein
LIFLKAEKVEKEKLKQLTLNINERIEQEELQGIFNENQANNVRSLFKKKNEGDIFFAVFCFDVSMIEVFIIKKYLSKGITI